MEVTPTPLNFYSYLLGKPQILRGLMNYEGFKICTLGHWASRTWLENP